MKKVLLTLIVSVVSLIAAANVAGACVCTFYQPEID
ncbi:MAG: cyclic lactone autoinducer peptide [Ignavibacteriales bacterium]